MKTGKNMKRIASMLVYILIIGALSGCGSSSAPKTNNGQNSRTDKPSASENNKIPDRDEKSESETESGKNDITSNDGSFEAGDIVDKETILDYIESGSEYAVVYAVRRGEEYQIAGYYDEDGQSTTLVDFYEDYEADTKYGLIAETTILEISASQNDEFVYFGNGSLFLDGISSYHYAAPFPIANASYGEEIPGEFTAHKASYRTIGHYMKNKIEGPDSWDTFHKWTITEVNGISAADASVQNNLIVIGGRRNNVYVLLNDAETIRFGGYENTTWNEAEFKCGYMIFCPDKDFLHLEGTRTKEGYTIIANGSELRALGDYTAFMYGNYGLVQVVD
ncbi:MAG: hypothetical protein K2K63_11545 [Acetatifactor sp.]|nr:hypothetical protein [Acetatifactor sp.]